LGLGSGGGLDVPGPGNLFQTETGGVDCIGRLEFEVPVNHSGRRNVLEVFWRKEGGQQFWSQVGTAAGTVAHHGRVGLEVGKVGEVGLGSGVDQRLMSVGGWLTLNRLEDGTQLCGFAGWILA